MTVFIPIMMLWLARIQYGRDCRHESDDAGRGALHV